MSNLNKWASWYADADEQRPYINNEDDATYRIAAEWLDGLPVEDWGSGFGWFGLLHNGAYLAVDGTPSRWCDLVADLAHYRSTTPGLLLRHVLEHDHQWAAILDNAVASFTERMCVILFTPLQFETQVLAEDVGGLGVPDIGFALDDLTARLTGCRWTVEQVPSDTAYAAETVLRVER